MMVHIGVAALLNVPNHIRSSCCAHPAKKRKYFYCSQLIDNVMSGTLSLVLQSCHPCFRRPGTFSIRTDIRCIKLGASYTSAISGNLLRLLIWTGLPALSLSETATETNSPSGSEGIAVGSAVESYTLASFAFLFGISISLVSVAIIYISLLEDALLRKFDREGTTVEGQVVAEDLSLVRHMPQSFSQKGNTEYVAQVQYRFHEVNGYTSIVRKHIKALDSDFYQTSKERNERHGSNNIVQLHVELPDDELSESDLCKHFDNGSDVVFQEYPPDQQYIQLLFLPGHPHSALPKQQVARELQGKRWLPTAMLGIALVSISGFCVHMGLSNALMVGNNTELATSLMMTLTWTRLLGLTMAATLALLLVDGLLINWFCHNLITEALTDGYLEGGEMMVKMDDETLATMSSCFSEECFSTPNSPTGSSDQKDPISPYNKLPDTEITHVGDVFRSQHSIGQYSQ